MPIKTQDKYSVRYKNTQARSKPNSAVAADRAKRRRQQLLRKALPAMRILWEAGVETDPIVCVWHYTQAEAELAHLDGTLGVVDHDRIDAIAALFVVEPFAIDYTWFRAALELEEGHGHRHQHAAKALADGDLAVIAHKPLADLKAAAHAFQKTPERDKALFGKRPGRNRIRTGLPTLAPDHSGCVRVVPDGPGSDRLSRSERKALAQELDVKTETVRKAEIRHVTDEAFEAWANKLRKSAETKRRKAEEKLKRENRRKRKPGKTALVRRYASMADCHLSTAWRRCEGKSEAQIAAFLDKFDLVHIGGYGQDESDKDALHPAFSGTADERHESTDHSQGESDSESDKDPSYPAFFCNFHTHSICAETQDFAPEAANSNAFSPLTATSTELSETLDAWAVLRARPTTATEIDAQEKASAYRAYNDLTRASTVYGQTIPSDDEHTATIAKLHADADRARSEWATLQRGYPW